MPRPTAKKAPRPAATKPASAIGFVGAGNMAGALILGLLQSKAIAPRGIVASDVKSERLAQLAKQYGIRVTTDNHALVRESSIVVLSVKPQVVDKLLTVIGPDIRKDQLVISIAAGVPIAALEARLPAGTPRRPHDAQRRGPRARRGDRDLRRHPRDGQGSRSRECALRSRRTRRVPR